MSMLEVTDLCVNYGGIKALKGISFSVEEGQICTLIGANGAGKSTALRAISGLVPVKSGSIRFTDQELSLIHILVEGKDFSFPVIRQVAVLKAFPGWSEFLISFALYGAAAIVLFPVWKKLLNCKIAFWIVWTLSFAAVFIPYDQIANIRIAMLIGGRQASFFPILQYLPYFLMGMYISKYGMRKPGFWILGAALLTGAGLARTLIAGEPSRFPPSIWWILLAWLPIAVAHVSLKALADRIGDKAAIALKPLGNMGANSLYFLLASNLTIFAVSRIGVMPLYRKSAPFPFYLKQGTTGWAIAWTAIMLIVIGFTARLAGKRTK